MGLQNELPKLPHLQAGHVKLMIAQKVPDEQGKKNEELKKLKEQMQILQKEISSMKGADEVTDMNKFSP